MPPKRVSAASLTGGTGDVNPQQMTLFVVQTAADASTFVAIPNPVPRFPGNNNRAIVMEVLAVDWYNVNPFTVTATNVVTGALSTRAPSAAAFTATQLFADPATFALYQERTLFATAVGFQTSTLTEQHDDLTDGAGHGHLVATDNIVLSVASVATGITNTIYAKITYRFKEIGLAEYVGIVQSQQ